MFKSILSDIKRTIFLENAHRSSFIQKMFVLSFAYGLHVMILFRIRYGLRLQMRRIWIAPLVYPFVLVMDAMLFALKIMYGIAIDPSADIGEGFYIGHFADIHIGPCFIGKNCSIHQMVSIGIQPSPSGKTCDVKIGDNVWIGGHSVICKGVSIGSGATVVVGSRVITDILPRAMAMGNPARPIQKNFDNSSLMGY